MRRCPTFPLALALSIGLIGNVLATAQSWAAWSADGVTVRSTASSIPLVSACWDGTLGTFVVWQEESSPGHGLLRAQHLLSNGDLDPAWPAAGALVSDYSASRSQLRSIPDHLGGAYVTWKEGSSIFANRVDAGGQVASAWPARGRFVGTTSTNGPVPSLIEDGATGFFMAWATEAVSDFDDPNTIVAIHLGSANTGAGGWPNGTRAVAPFTDVYTTDLCPQLALAPDGGIFVAWGSWSSDSSIVESLWRLRRMTSAGLNAAGWPLEGRDFGVFHGEMLDPNFLPLESSLIALSDDARGGAFMVIANPTGSDGYSQVDLDTRIYRRQGDGETAADWPDAGRAVQNDPGVIYPHLGSNASYRVMTDTKDGALVGTPMFYSEFTNTFSYRACTAEGDWVSGSGIEAGMKGYELAPRGDGGLYMADFNPTGPTGPYMPGAYLAVRQSLAPPGWSDYSEYHSEPFQAWYGDIGLAPTGDGGAVFYWSQVNERIGLFARRFNTGGQVTGVSDRHVSLGLRSLRFVPGAGVRAAVSVPAGATARLDLFDVAGRRVASERIRGAGGMTEVALGGTSELSSGLYFGRVSSGGEAFAAKVVVAR